jgi:hypothetical protein
MKYVFQNFELFLANMVLKFQKSIFVTSKLCLHKIWLLDFYIYFETVEKKRKTISHKKVIYYSNAEKTDFSNFYNCLENVVFCLLFFCV